MHFRQIRLIAIVFLSLLLAGCASAQAPTPAAPAAPSVGSGNSSSQPANAPTLAAQPNCTAGAALTPEMTEGPFFKAGSAERTSLLDAGTTGTKLTLTGYVFTPDCKPVAHALLDFWQANANGQYDNNGYTLRGHQFSDANGRYQLTTIVPGLYPGRTEHIHVKVQAPNGPVLTTQLFFPGVPRNTSDPIFDSKLLMTVQDTGGALSAVYNFVVKSAQ